MADKPKLAIYGASCCGGCDISILEIHERILDIAETFDLVYWPCIIDVKKKELYALRDDEIAFCLFNGAIRTEEDEEMAHLLRKKSKLFIAYGSCAHEGSIPGLSNLYSAEDHFNSIYLENPTTVNNLKKIPISITKMPDGNLSLPVFYDTVKTLGQTTDVDYFIPGCPPESHQVEAAFDAIKGESPLPDRGSVISAGSVALCEECPKKKEIKKLRHLFRPHELFPDNNVCLLAQGIVCMGPATRSGCGALCPQNNMPCIGCYGTLPNAIDQGANMLSAIASLLDISFDGKTESELEREIDDVIKTIPDLVGLLYKFSLPVSILQKSKSR